MTAAKLFLPEKKIRGNWDKEDAADRRLPEHVEMQAEDQVAANAEHNHEVQEDSQEKELNDFPGEALRPKKTSQS